VFVKKKRVGFGVIEPAGLDGSTGTGRVGSSGLGGKTINKINRIALFYFFRYPLSNMLIGQILNGYKLFCNFI
jgi:hypothetical protein